MVDRGAALGPLEAALLGSNKAAKHYRRPSRPLEKGFQPSGLRRSYEGIKASSYTHFYVKNFGEFHFHALRWIA